MTYSESDITNLLINYHAERESISKTITNLQKQAADLFYPESFHDIKVQNEFRQGQLIDSMLRRCDESREYQRRTLRDIKDMSDTLDRLMFHVNGLPGKLKLIVIDTMIEGETIRSYAERMGKLPETVSRHKRRALSILVRRMNNTKIGVSMS